MIIDSARLLDIVGASTDLEDHTDLERGLRQLAVDAAERLRTARCSIMLLREDEEVGEPCLRVFAHHGDLPNLALEKATGTDEGIAGYVLTTGRPLLVQDITQSEFARHARYPQAAHKGLICAPLRIGQRVVGVINVSEPLDGQEFDDDDLKLVEILALVVSRSIHVFQLQGILGSKLLQAAAAHDAAQGPSGPIAPDPGRLTALVAKSIYRELTGAGFGPSQVISVATGVIDQLKRSLEGDGDTDRPPPSGVRSGT